jgi:SAM-dependent methyltransferase/FKBP-type peptidyl-prolyl cis-trans isomerase 2
MNRSKQAQLEVALCWLSVDATHTDRRFFDPVNFWRDFFPRDLGERLDRTAPGETLTLALPAGELTEPYDPGQRRTIRRAQFVTTPAPGTHIVPFVGRFVPRTLVRDVDLFFAGDRRPCRVIAADAESLTLDFNHPFARFPATLEATVVGLLEPKPEHGGRSTDIPQELTNNGPGMQARLPDPPTGFFAADGFTRLDARDDALFYSVPRLVQHIDRQASAHIAALYRRFLSPGMRVLDLMTSWVSHLPADVANLAVTGLGMNVAELSQNPALCERVIHDLNQQPQLPFADAAFDVAVCTVSVEYLTQPIEVFRAVRRVLKPGAPFIVTFSDRWFPTKVVALWKELHAFERMGLVLDYFRRSGGYTQLATESWRGWPRPEDDPYANSLLLSDPVFAVWGYRA